MNTVTISMSLDEAEAIRDGLADILCWVAGFEAGRAGTDQPGGPIGVERARDMSLKLRSAIGVAIKIKENLE